MISLRYPHQDSNAENDRFCHNCGGSSPLLAVIALALLALFIWSTWAWFYNESKLSQATKAMESGRNQEAAELMGGLTFSPVHRLLGDSGLEGDVKPVLVVPSEARVAMVLERLGAQSTLPDKADWLEVGGRLLPTKYVDKVTGAVMVLILPGTFQIGSAKTEKDRAEDEGPAHEVKIVEAYYLGETELTQGQWFAVMGTRPWKGKENVKEGADCPATHVSWDDAVAFCAELSKKGGGSYRLPTEAEWEHACRAGTTTRFSYGEDPNYARLKDYAWHKANAWDAKEKYAHPVAKKAPNPLGLHDMHGNLWEWCSDRYASTYPSGPVTNPKGPLLGRKRVVRGGSWNLSAKYCRSAARIGVKSASRYYDQGFRVARSMK